MTVSYMRHASGHDYRNSSFIVDVAVGQIPRSTERISSSVTFQKIMVLKISKNTHKTKNLFIDRQTLH